MLSVLERVWMTLLAMSILNGFSAAQYSATYKPSASGLPPKTEDGQTGTNNCGTQSSATSMCQNFYINDITDWCVWAPPNGGEVAANEAVEGMHISLNICSN